MTRRSLGSMGLLALAACHGPAFILKDDGSCSATATGGAGPASVLWTSELGHSGYPHALGVGADGQVAIAGMFSGSTKRSFVALLDRKGSVRWLREFAGHSTFSSVAIGKDGSVAVNATFRGVIELAGQKLSPIGDEDAYVAKWSAAGDPLWMRALQGKYEDQAGPVVVDDDGDVHFALRIAGDPITLGGKVVTDMVVGTLAGKDGTVTSVGSYRGGRPLSLALDRSAPSRKGLVLVGFYEEELHLGYDAQQKERVLRLGAYDHRHAAFVVKLRSPTDIAWADNDRITDEFASWYDIDPSVAVSPSGNIATVANGGGSKRTTNVSRWDANGKRLWERCFVTEAGSANATAVAIADDETVNVAGNFQTGYSYVDQDGPLFVVRYSVTGDPLDSSVRFRSSKIAPGAVAVDDTRAIWIGAAFHGKSDEQATDDIVVQAFGRR